MEPLEVIAFRIAQLALRDIPHLGRAGPGPVLSVVRDTRFNKIYVGLNGDIPRNLADGMEKAIERQRARISRGEVNVVHSDPNAVGGHSEVIALNEATLYHEKQVNRKLTEADRRVFELHNVWLKGQQPTSRELPSAPR